jgi:hypothetical protein
MISGLLTGFKERGFAGTMRCRSYKDADSRPACVATD